MGRMVKIVVGVLLLSGVSLGLLRLPTVQDRLVEKAIQQRMDNSHWEALFADDALRLFVCGSSSPFPAEDRARPCLGVIAGGKYYIVDTGPGSWNRMALLRIPAERIGGVFITHFHSDHIGDLGEFNLQSWVAGRQGPLPVFGPPGVERVVSGYNEAYALDQIYRVEHHGAALLDPDSGQMQARVVPLGQEGAASVALEAGDLRVQMFPVPHEPIAPAVGYRFDYRGRSILISGDTRKDLNLARWGQGVDVLAHEAQNNHIVEQISQVADALDRPRYAQVMRDIPSYHTTPVEAAEVANAAGAGLLLLYHLTPPPPNAVAAWAFLRGVRELRPEGTLLARDGQLIELPLDGSEPQVSMLP